MIPLELQRLKEVIVRNAILPLQMIYSLPSNDGEMSELAERLYHSDSFKEGVFIASPILFGEWTKLYTTEVPSQKARKIEKSILKYFMRAFSVCSPFGLFAAYSLSGDKTDVSLSIHQAEYKKIGYWGYNFVNSVVARVIDLVEGRNILPYKLNPTIYRIGHRNRYIEDYSGLGIESVISSFDSDQVTELLLNYCARTERSFSELTRFLLNHIADIEESDAENYIRSLIQEKILLASFQLSLNGMPPLQQLTNFFTPDDPNKLKSYPELAALIDGLKTLEDLMSQITSSQSFNHTLHHYNECFQFAQSLVAGASNEHSQNIISINLKKTCTEVTNDHKEDEQLIREGLAILDTIFTPDILENLSPIQNLNHFKRTFLRRYNEGEYVQLLKVLDTESGIGYLKDDKTEINDEELLSDLNIRASAKSPSHLFTTNLDTFWFPLILKCIEKGDTVIDLKQERTNILTPGNKKVGGTFSVLYKKSGKQIVILSAGGASATHYIGRFTTYDEELKKLADKIADEEAIIFHDFDTAEISYKVSAEAADISHRNIKRKHEIEITANSKSTSLSINDLYITVIRDRVVLRNKNSGKEIIPFISCAQNIHGQMLPHYKLFCDLQFQYRQNFFDLYIGNLAENYCSFIPRIQYGANIIFSLARWKLRKKEIVPADNGTADDFLNKFPAYKAACKLPRFVSLFKNNESSLLLDLENYFALSILWDELRKTDVIEVCEFLAEEIDNGRCNEEYVMNFKAKTSLETVDSSDMHLSAAQDIFAPGEEWIYFKIYTGVYCSNDILISFIKPLLRQFSASNLFDKWFYLRYKDPSNHLRIRIHTENNDHIKEIIDTLGKGLAPLQRDGVSSDVELSTYKREIFRYTSQNIQSVETIFFHDSEMTLELLSLLKNKNEEQDIWLYSLKYIDSLLISCGYDVRQKQRLSFKLFSSFSAEFNVQKEEKKVINKKFRLHRQKIDRCLKEETSDFSIEIRKTIKAVKPLLKKIETNLKRNKFEDILFSIIHMHVNRAVKAGPRMYEWLLYSFLNSYYLQSEALERISN